MIFRALLFALTVATVQGFAGLSELASSGVPHAIPHALHHAQVQLATANPAANLLETYTHTLKAHPLATKMFTGGVLATCGDAIAQSRTDEDYDKRRAASFGTFDMAYRALQHVSFPVIVAQFQGQYAAAFLGSLGMMSMVQDHTSLLAAMEQTLASQLGIVPFLYYPVFFALTGAMQGLTTDQAVNRAKETFIPLMQRNLLFWIPVQFVQFAFIPTDLQIPFLSICGLCWTFILSAFAGSTKGYSNDNEEEALVTEMATAEEMTVIESELARMAAHYVLEEGAEAIAAESEKEQVEEGVEELAFRR